MGILEMFNPPNEGKEMEQQEQRHMQFQKEQNAVAVTAPEEQTEIMNQEGKSDLLKWQQDLDPELETITFRLTGWTKRGGEWVKTDRRPLCNELFMNDVVAPQLEPFLTKNLINSSGQTFGTAPESNSFNHFLKDRWNPSLSPAINFLNS